MGSDEIARLNKNLFPTNSEIEIIDTILHDKVLLNELFPSLKQTCIKFALKDFLPVCLNNGIENVDMDIKVETAVRLSICQFEASGLENIPQSCSHYQKIDELMECMLTLENFHDWWITYNGYYQNLSEICVQNSLPYQKDQVLKMFLNLTKWVDHINDKWAKGFDDILFQMSNVTEIGLDKMNTKFQESADKWENYSNSKLDNMKIQFDSHNKDLDEFFKSNNEKIFKEISFKDEKLVASVNNFQDEIIRINNQIEIMSIPKTLNTIQNNWEKYLSDMVNSGQESLEQQMNDFFFSVNSHIYQEMVQFQAANNASLNALVTNLNTIKEDFTLSWGQMLEYNMDIFETKINEKLEVMTKNIDKTIDQIDFLQFKLDRLIKFTKLAYNTVFIIPRYVIKLFNFLISNTLFSNGEKTFGGIIILISYYIKSSYKYKIDRINKISKIIIHNIRINKKMINWTLIFVSIYLGRRFINTVI